jgi:hypothetical protein
MRDKVEQEEQAQIPETAAVEAEPPAPRSDDLALASVVGNRAMSMAVAAQRGRGGRERISRDVDVPPAPVTLNAPAEREKDAFQEEDKERARKTVIAPLRAGAEQLGAGTKANMGSVIRHVEPVKNAIIGVKWQPQELLSQAMAAVAELPADVEALKALKLSDRQAITKTKGHWAAARKQLQSASKEIQKASGPDKKHPDREFREDSPQDLAAITALSAQILATSKDLSEAPRTQDGYMAVEKTAASVLEQFETIQPPDDGGFVKGAKLEMEQGMMDIAPLALGKEDAIKAVAGDLTRMANEIAQLVGDEPAEDQKEDDEPDPSKDNTPPTDVAPNPNPLPPPPVPKGGADKKTPAPQR